MAVVKALVWRDDVTPNAIGRMQDGDTLEGGSSTTILTANNQGTTMTIGQAVYVSGDDHVSLARADMLPTSRVVGLVESITITNGSPGNIKTAGPLIASTGQWDAVTGQTGGLTPAKIYFLSNTVSGRITVTPPTTGVVIQLGVAKDETTFVIDIKPLVKLRA